MKKVTNFKFKPGTNELVLQKNFSVENKRYSQVVFMCIDLVISRLSASQLMLWFP